MSIYIVTSTTGDKWELCPSTWLINAKNRDNAMAQVQNRLNGDSSTEKIIDCTRYDQGQPGRAVLLQGAVVE